MFVVMNSQNAKIGNIAATYLPIKSTCPTTCKLKDNGCYAQLGNVGFQVRRLERVTEGKKAYDIIRAEAREITAKGKLANGKTLRMHVSGDCRTAKSAKLLAKAATYWNGKVYTYTHAWRSIPKESWGSISVLASCESIEDAKDALKAGYAPSIVVDKHVGERAYMQDGVKVIPCPSQTRGITCDKCNLCMNDRVLIEQGAAIGFAAHGAGSKRALKVIQ